MNKSNDSTMARFLAGEMSTKEEIAFRKEIESDPAQQFELNNMEKTWKYFDNNASERNRDSMKAWNILKGRLENDGLLEDQAAVHRIRNIRSPLKAAASIWWQ